MSLASTDHIDRRAPLAGGDPDAPLVQCIDVKTHFKTPKGLARAVDGVTLSLAPGKALGIVGESGSGKSVLSRTIMGLLPPKVTVRSGTVLFGGIDISRGEQDAQRFWGTEMAMIFQDPMTSLNPVMKIGNQIGETLRLHYSMSKSEALERSIYMLGLVGIPQPDKRANQYPHELSGGMRQRAMIAVALAGGPRLIFADEPTTALDVTVQAQILDLLSEMQTEREMGMILVTHDLGVVAGRTDEIAVMYAGRIVEQAPTSELFKTMAHPYSAALLASIPKLEDPKHTKLTSIPGRPPDIVSPPKGCAFAERCPNALEICRTRKPQLTIQGQHSYACFNPVTDAPASQPEEDEKR